MDDTTNALVTAMKRY